MNRLRGLGQVLLRHFVLVVIPWWPWGLIRWAVAGFEVVVASSPAAGAQRIGDARAAMAAQLDLVVDEAVMGFGMLPVAVYAPVEHSEEEDGEDTNGDAAYQGGLVNHRGCSGGPKKR